MALTSFVGGALFGRRFGDAQPRVLGLHGWQRDHTDWAAVLDGLDAIAVDLPGFGATPPPPAVWGSARYAEEIAPLLDEMAAPVVVAGHSFGGRVAIHLAAIQPDRIAGLVLSGVPNLWPLPDRPPRRPPLAYRVTRWLHRRGLVSDERMEARRQRHGSADYRAARGVMRDVLVTAVNERYDHLLRHLDLPIELVWGSDDDAAPLAGARATAEEVPGARLTVVDDAGHFTLQSAVGEVRRAIDRILDDTG